MEIKVLSTQNETNRLNSLLQNADRGAQMLHRFLNYKPRGDPLKTLPTEVSAKKAQQVFEIAELAEMILLELEPRDILAALEVNKAFAASVDGSSKLQTKLCYRSESCSTWRSNFFVDDKRNKSIRPKLTCALAKRFWFLPRYWTENPLVYVTLAISRESKFGGGEFPRILRKFHSMLICQPPITEMVAMPKCCESRGRELLADIPDPSTPITITSSTGITVRDLLDVAWDIYVGHQYCPYLDQLLHGEDGRVYPNIEFTGLSPPEILPPPSPSSGCDCDYSAGGEHSEPNPKYYREQFRNVERYFNAKDDGKPFVILVISANADDIQR